MMKSSIAIEYVDPKTLKPWDNNPRVMSKKDEDALKASIKEFGLVEPIVARRADRLVVGGHMRLKASVDLGFTSVPVVFIDVNDAQMQVLNIALNQISGEFDYPKLMSILDGIKISQEITGLNLELTGFTAADLTGFHDTLDTDAPIPEPEPDSFEGAGSDVCPTCRRPLGGEA
jgi:hypothetical protein